MSVLQAVLAAILLLLAVPSLPAHWASITHFNEIRSGGGGAGEVGKVTVEHCERGPLIPDWSCSGTFTVGDPMAEPYQPTSGVRIANDFRNYRTGTSIGAVLSVGGHIGYRWGGIVQVQTLAYWLGTLVCLVVLIVAIVILTRRRRSYVAIWGLLVVGLLLIGVSASF